VNVYSDRCEGVTLFCLSKGASGLERGLVFQNVGGACKCRDVGPYILAELYPRGRTLIYIASAHNATSFKSCLAQPYTII